MTPKQKQRLLIVLAILVAAVLATVLIVYAVGENMNLYRTPTQVAAGDVPDGQAFKVGGMVMDGSVQREPGSLKVRFTLTDYQHQVNVSYDRILPDLFREGQGIVATGRLDSEGVFVADEVLAKHDENYMPREVQQTLEASGKAGYGGQP